MSMIFITQLFSLNSHKQSWSRYISWSVNYCQFFDISAEIKIGTFGDSVESQQHIWLFTVSLLLVSVNCLVLNPNKK